MSSPTARKRQPYAVAACDVCRRRKKRCDRTEDSVSPCSQCLLVGSECTVSRSLVRRRYNRVSHRKIKAPASSTETSPTISPFQSPFPSPTLSPTPSFSSASTFSPIAQSRHFNAESPPPLPPSPPPPPARGFVATDELPSITPLSAGYINAYFNIFSGTDYRYFFEVYIDPAAFRVERDAIAAQLVQADTVWALCLATVLAVGARMSSDVNYAEYAEGLAARALSNLLLESEQSAFMYKWRPERRALAYRSVLLLASYKFMIDQPVNSEVDLLHRIIADPYVVDLLPNQLVRLLPLAPHFMKIYRQYFAVPPNTPAIQEEQGRSYAASQLEYYKLKRMLRLELNLAPNDPELLCATEYDAITQVDRHVDAEQLDLHFAELNHRLQCCAADDFSFASLQFDIYHSLCILLKVEVMATGVHLIYVHSRKATLYELMYNIPMAVHSARLTVKLLVQSDTPTALILPCHLTLTRAVGILVKWDEGDEAAALIHQGLNILRKHAGLWSGADAGLQILLTHLTASMHDRERRIAQRLNASRQVLEQQVISCINRELKPELTEAARQFLHHSHSMEVLQYKRLSVM